MTSPIRKVRKEVYVKMDNSLLISWMKFSNTFIYQLVQLSRLSDYSQESCCWIVKTLVIGVFTGTGLRMVIKVSVETKVNKLYGVIKRL